MTWKGNPQTGRKYFQTTEWQGVNIQNIQRAHATQYQNKQTNKINFKKEDLNRHLFKEDI